MKQPPQYIGVTGVTSPDHTKALLDCLPLESKRKVMIGVLASSKTIRGIPNKWPRRYPAAEDLGKIFVDDPRALNLVHFNTKEEGIGSIMADMLRAAELAGPLCHGLQLNMWWPNPDLLAAWRMRRLSNNLPHKLVLQIGASAMATIAKEGLALSRMLTPYIGSVDYILLDPSGGEGKPFNVDIALDQLSDVIAAQFTFPLGLGVAGGFAPGKLDPLRRVAERYEVSCDVEGRVRDKNDDLDILAACEYVKEADAVLGWSPYE